MGGGGGGGAFWLGLNVLIGQAQVNVEARLLIVMTETPHETRGPGGVSLLLMNSQNELTSG